MTEESDSTELEEAPKAGVRQMEKVNKNLTGEQRAAAMLEAIGYTDRESSAVVGVSKQTIQRYRREVEGYKEAVVIFKERDVQLMEPLVARFKVELLDAARESIITLREALNAETIDGQPRWPVRNEAAALILSHVNMVVGTVQAEGGGNGGSGDDAALVNSREPLVIQINPTPQQAPVQVPNEAQEPAVDADVVEES